MNLKGKSYRRVNKRGEKTMANTGGKKGFETIAHAPT